MDESFEGLEDSGQHSPLPASAQLLVYSQSGSRSPPHLFSQDNAECLKTPVISNCAAYCFCFWYLLNLKPRCQSSINTIFMLSDFLLFLFFSHVILRWYVLCSVPRLALFHKIVLFHKPLLPRASVHLHRRYSPAKGGFSTPPEHPPIPRRWRQKLYHT